MKFIIYWVSVAFFPFIYQSLWARLNMPWAFWPYLLLMLTAATALAFNVAVVPAAFILIFHVTFMPFVDYPMVDLDWWYMSWVLCALILMQASVPRKSLIELGWLMGGATFTIHGVAKLVQAGEPWIKGEVVVAFMTYILPDITHVLYANGSLFPVAAGVSWAVLAMHLLALPLALYKPGRKYFLIMVIAFHLSVMISPLYFISVGFFAFWIFLLEGTRPELAQTLR